MIKIALMGYGVIGSGVVKVIEENQKIIADRLGEGVFVKYILEIKDLSGTPYADRVVKDISVILNDPEISIVVEVMGGIHPAADFTRAALEAGKSVVTANKAVVADCGDELLALARERGVRYLFEASVGGGIPVIRPLIDDLASNEILSVCGILNGTTNYILTQMAERGCDFETALREAQEKGYAEADPTADVEGIDALRKAVILGAISFGKLLPIDALYSRGICEVRGEEAEIAKKLGCTVKLIAGAQKLHDGRIFAAVTPEFVSNSCPLAHVNGVFNGVLVTCNMLGDAMFYGQGAGKLPTAGAVVADIMDAVERPFTSPDRLHWTRAEASDIVDKGDVMAELAEEYCHIFDDISAGIAAADVCHGSRVVCEGNICGVVTRDIALPGATATYAILSR